MTPYEQGFMAKCAEYGYTEEQSQEMLKQAARMFQLPSWREIRHAFEPNATAFEPNAITRFKKFYKNQRYAGVTSKALRTNAGYGYSLPLSGARTYHDIANDMTWRGKWPTFTDRVSFKTPPGLAPRRNYVKTMDDATQLPEAKAYRDSLRKVLAGMARGKDTHALEAASNEAFLDYLRTVQQDSVGSFLRYKSPLERERISWFSPIEATSAAFR